MIGAPKGDRFGRAGTWWPHEVGTRSTAYYCCTICKHSTSLHCHAIDDETGAVSPLVRCEACGHEQAVCLEGWPA